MSAKNQQGLDNQVSGKFMKISSFNMLEINFYLF
jgi:hypothetical protein